MNRKKDDENEVGSGLETVLNIIGGAAMIGSVVCNVAKQLENQEQAKAITTWEKPSTSARSYKEGERKNEIDWETFLAAIGGAAFVGAQMCKDFGKNQNQERANSIREERFCITDITRNSDEPDRCITCWKTQQPLRTLNCGHVFHHRCISTWLSEKSTCPLCRQRQ